MAKFVVLIEGNICAGKTTLIRYIQEHQELFQEFVDEGEQVKTIVEFIDHSWLKLFYQDRRKYSSWFEKSCLIGRIGRHFVAKDHKGLVFFDRGMLGGALTFCKNSFDEGYLRYDQWTEYLQMLRSGLDDLDRSEQDKWLEQLIVYLQVKDIDTLVRRSRTRNTEGEVVPAEYLARINDLYEDFIRNVDRIYRDYGLRPPEILNIDASVEFLNEEAYLKYIVDSIIQRIRGRLRDGAKD
jgi:deoxyadenosine/deoxycytidine kinase